MEKRQLGDLMRESIRSLVPYSSARTEFTGDARVFLDANENWRQFVGEPGINRYPDPAASELVQIYASYLGMKYENLTPASTACCFPFRRTEHTGCSPRSTT